MGSLLEEYHREEKIRKAMLKDINCYVIVGCHKDKKGVVHILNNDKDRLNIVKIVDRNKLNLADLD